MEEVCGNVLTFLDSASNLSEGWSTVLFINLFYLMLSSDMNL